MTQPDANKAKVEAEFQQRVSDMLGSTMRPIGRTAFGPMGANKSAHEYRRAMAAAEQAQEPTPMTQPDATKARFFVDERGGCIAVRDRTLVDPDRNGLHSDMECVVWYEHGIYMSERCPHCGTSSPIGWKITDEQREKAARSCATMNTHHLMAAAEQAQEQDNGTTR